jgi:hypothetical protein
MGTGVARGAGGGRADRVEGDDQREVTLVDLALAGTEPRLPIDVAIEDRHVVVLLSDVIGATVVEARYMERPDIGNGPAARGRTLELELHLTALLDDLPPLGDEF